MSNYRIFRCDNLLKFQYHSNDEKNTCQIRFDRSFCDVFSNWNIYIYIWLNLRSCHGSDSRWILNSMTDDRISNFLSSFRNYEYSPMISTFHVPMFSICVLWVMERSKSIPVSIKSFTEHQICMQMTIGIEFFVCIKLFTLHRFIYATIHDLFPSISILQIVKCLIKRDKRIASFSLHIASGD